MVLAEPSLGMVLAEPHLAKVSLISTMEDLHVRHLWESVAEKHRLSTRTAFDRDVSFADVCFLIWVSKSSATRSSLEEFYKRIKENGGRAAVLKDLSLLIQD